MITKTFFARLTIVLVKSIERAFVSFVTLVTSVPTGIVLSCA